MDYINKRFNNLNRYTKIPIIFQASDYIRYQEWLLIQRHFIKCLIHYLTIQMWPKKLVEWEIRTGDLLSADTNKPNIVPTVYQADVSTKRGESRGQWLWLSWLSSCFHLQRSAVRIQSLAQFIWNIHCQLYWKDEKKEKRGREWPTLKKRRQSLIIDTQIRLINEREEKERKAKAWK